MSDFISQYGHNDGSEESVSGQKKAASLASVSTSEAQAVFPRPPGIPQWTSPAEEHPKPLGSHPVNAQSDRAHISTSNQSERPPTTESSILPRTLGNLSRQASSSASERPTAQYSQVSLSLSRGGGTFLDSDSDSDSNGSKPNNRANSLSGEGTFYNDAESIDSANVEEDGSPEQNDGLNRQNQSSTIRASTAQENTPSNTDRTAPAHDDSPPLQRNRLQKHHLNPNLVNKDSNEHKGFLHGLGFRRGKNTLSSFKNSTQEEASQTRQRKKLQKAPPDSDSYRTNFLGLPRKGVREITQDPVSVSLTSRFTASFKGLVAKYKNTRV